MFDSGCFHHLPPHRRISYRRLLETMLRPGGAFGLPCFAAGGTADDGSAVEPMGTEVPDLELYRSGSLGGGLAYTAAELRRTFDWLTELDLTRMQTPSPPTPLFGEPFLWSALFRR
ncbi:hypothetical protein [Cellulomonas hominis]